MFDKLVISKAGANDNKTLRGLLVSTCLFVVSFMTFGLVYSLFSQSIAMGQENLNISALIAPPVIPENVPPKPEQIRENPKQSVDKPRIAIRKQHIQNMSEAPVETPDSISTSKLKSQARPKNTPYRIGITDTKGVGSRTNTLTSRCSGDCSQGVSIMDDPKNTKVEKPSDAGKTVAAPPKIQKPKPKIKIARVVNGLAKKLVKPPYPQAARALGVSGQVTVQVLIDEKGNVMSAKAVKGHALLKRASVKAARATKFTPTTLGKVPVKVRGLIIYNFKP